ncbi:hypothetical protein Tco_1213373 [Tanacetum coccineum]
MPYARLPTAANSSKPKPRSTNQMTRNWPTYKSSCVTKTDVPKAEHSRNSSSFLDSKLFVCLTCQKSVFNTDHDACITQLLKKVNSRTKVQPHKTTKRYIPVAKKSESKKPERRISRGQKFSLNKTSAMYMKTTPPRSGLTWKPTGRIFTYVGFRWIPTGKSVGTCFNTNDSTIPLGKETCSPKTIIYVNSSSLSAGTSTAYEPISSKGSSDVVKEDEVLGNEEVVEGKETQDGELDEDGDDKRTIWGMYADRLMNMLKLRPIRFFRNLDGFSDDNRRVVGSRSARLLLALYVFHGIGLDLHQTLLGLVGWCVRLRRGFSVGGDFGECCGAVELLCIGVWRCGCWIGLCGGFLAFGGGVWWGRGYVCCERWVLVVFGCLLVGRCGVCVVVRIVVAVECFGVLSVHVGWVLGSGWDLCCCGFEFGVGGVLVLLVVCDDLAVGCESGCRWWFIYGGVVVRVESEWVLCVVECGVAGGCGDFVLWCSCPAVDDVVVGLLCVVVALLVEMLWGVCYVHDVSVVVVVFVVKVVWDCGRVGCDCVQCVVVVVGLLVGLSKLAFRVLVLWGVFRFVECWVGCWGLVGCLDIAVSSRVRVDGVLCVVVVVVVVPRNGVECGCGIRFSSFVLGGIDGWVCGTVWWCVGCVEMVLVVVEACGIRCGVVWLFVVGFVCGSMGLVCLAGGVFWGLIVGEWVLSSVRLIVFGCGVVCSLALDVILLQL